MAWTLKSDKTGKTYDFEDDVAPEEALKWLDKVAEPAQSWGNTLSTIPQAIYTGLAKAQAGIPRVGEEFIKEPLEKAFNAPLEFWSGKTVPTEKSALFKATQATSKQAEEQLKAETEGVPSLGQQAVQSAAVSIGEMLPDTLMGVGAARGLMKAGATAADAISTVVSIGLKSMAGREFGREYQEQREAGTSPLPALGHAGVSAVAEYLPETWAWKPVLGLLRTPDAGVREAVTSFIFKEIGGESITTASQWLNRKLSREPDLTLGDLVHELQVTALSTGISGPVQGGLAGAAYRVALRKGMEQELASLEDTKAAAGGERIEPKVGEGPRAERGKYTVDSELPLVGMPGNGEAIPREMPLEVSLEKLRTAWAVYQNKSFQDTPEDRIRKKDAFMRARAEVEQSLQFWPEGRSLLRASDLELGLAPSNVTTRLETEVDELTAMTPRQLEELQALRTEATAVPDVPNVPQDLKTDLGMPNAGGASIDRPAVASERAYDTQAEAESFAGRPALHSSGKYNGLTYEDVKAQAQPGEVVYFAEKGQENTHAASAIYEVISSLTQAMLPGYRVFIGDMTSEAGVNSHAFVLGDKTLGFTLPRLEGMNTKKTFFNRVRNIFQPEKDLFDIVDTAVHEFTHLLHLAHWEGTPQAERAGVAQEYHDDLRAALAGTVEQAMHRLYSPKTAARMIKEYVKAGGSKSDGMRSARAKQLLPAYRNPTYWYNFNEWLAHKGAKYFYTRLGVRQENVGFFQRLVAKFRKFYSELARTNFKPTETFAQWMDNIVMRESGLKDVVDQETVSKAKAELLAKGVLPEVADMLEAVSGDNAESIRQRARALKFEVDADAAVEKASRLAAMLKAAGRAGSVEALAKAIPLPAVSELVESPLFMNGGNAAHLLDAIAQLYFRKNVHRAESGNFALTIFDTAAGEVSIVYDKKENSISIDGDVELAPVALTFALRDLAAQGQTKVKMDGWSKELKKFFGLDGRYQWLEIPFYSFEKGAVPQTADQVDLALRMPAALNALGAKYNIPFLQSSANALGRFNAFFGKALGAYELIKLNEHVPGMREERQALRNRMAYRHKWLKRADATTREWMEKLPKTETPKLARLLFDEAESGKWFSTMQQSTLDPNDRVFTLDPAVVQARKLAPQTVEIYSRIRNDFMRFAEEWQKTGLWELARAELSDVTHLSLSEAMRVDTPLADFVKIFNMAVGTMADPNAQARVMQRRDELMEAFENWKAKPYMPHTRFGRYGVLVRDAATGKTKYFAGFDTLREAEKHAQEVHAQFASDAVSTTYLEDVPYMFAGLPPQILDAMKDRLGLDQAQLDAFSEIMKKLSHANSFVHRASKQKGIEGYSLDAMRAYADYFRRGATFLARTKSQPELEDAMKLLRQAIARETSQNGEVTNAANLGRLHDWFNRLHMYLNNPGTEYGELKSMLSLWHFGFNASSAAMNMFQVPMVTYPYLAQRYGDAKALGALKKAYADVALSKFTWTRMTADEQAMLEHALESGFRDESQATVLAQLADGGALARASAYGAWQRGAHALNTHAMWMFGKAELVNRDVTLLAAYRLARQASFHGKFDRDAFESARTATEDTQNEYAQENRPEIMRGAGGVVFQFMHYVQHMLFMMFGGDASWLRLLLMQLVIAGGLGMPLVGDGVSLAKALARQAGIDFDVEREMALYFAQISEDPYRYLRGLGHDVFGFDLSKRISLGEVIPGAQAIGSNRKFSEVIAGAVGDVGGPAVSILMNLFKFMSENDKTSWNALRAILPTAVRNIGNAAVAFTEGAVKDRGGAVLFEPDVWDVIGMAAGFQPKELSEKYQLRTLQQEQAAYWTTRRQALLEIGASIYLDRGQDREAMADFMKRLKDYNESAPDPKLRITGKAVKASVQARYRARMERESGISRTTPLASQELREVFPASPAQDRSQPGSE